MLSLVKISFKYWRNNVIKLFSLVFSIFIGVAVLCTTLLLVRGLKLAWYDTLLSFHGDYDEIFYEVDGNAKDIIMSNEGVTGSGCYKNIGYIGDDNNVFAAASFDDEMSETIYHMPCVDGHYPIEPNEIAVDISFVESLGLSHYPGDSIKLSLYDRDHSFISTEEYKISGIFEATNNETYGGWHRYPYDLSETEYTDMPAVFVHKTIADKVSSYNYTVFIQIADDRYYKTCQELGDDQRVKCLGNPMTHSRTVAYEALLKLDNDYYSDSSVYDGSNSGIDRAIHEGYGNKDVYSRYLIPIFTVLIFVIVFILVFNNVKNLIMSRKPFYGVLRMIGMSSKGCALYILSELLIISIVSSFWGLIAGWGCHVLSIELVNRFYDTKLVSGTAGNLYVDAVTYNPWTLPVIVALITVCLASAGLVLRSLKEEPVILINNADTDRSIKNRLYHQRSSTWIKLISRRVDLCSHASMIMLMIVMSSGLFGYLFFRAYSDLQSSQYNSTLEMNNLDKYDYSITTIDLPTDGFYVSNHHNYGVSSDKIAELKTLECIDSIDYYVWNLTTRLTYHPDDLDDRFGDLFKVDLSEGVQSDDPIVSKAQREAHSVLMSRSGYDPNDKIYAVPTLGLSEDQIKRLNIISGNIDLTELANGNKVLLCVPDGMSDAVSEVLPVGSKLQLSDIVLDQEEEQLPFGNIDYTDPDMVLDYRKIVDDIFVFAKSYGKRQDISTSIGAIVVLTDEQKKYYPSWNDGPFIIGLDTRTFKSWHLPDINCSNVVVKLKADCNRLEADRDIWNVIGGSEGIHTESSFLVWEKIYRSNLEVMSVYYMLMINLLIVGCVAIAMSLYTKLKVKVDQINLLRMIGMSVGQVSKVLLMQNIFYPFEGAIVSIIPVTALQIVFNYVHTKLQSGAWDNDPSVLDGSAWFMDLPYMENMFSYGFVPALIVCFVVGVLLILIGTLPQIVYVKRHKLITE